MVDPKNSSTHFQGKEAIGHIAEVQAEGILSSLESHYNHAVGHYQAAYEAAREASLVLSMLILLLTLFSSPQVLPLLIIFAAGWTIWKVAKSAWLGWQRLEKFHRLIAEEKWEIEHHREQEREELIALYGAKGFEGALLKEVVDVLMSDEDRLLRVMIEEELNLQLENQEHPLKEAFGALLGSSISCTLILSTFYLFPSWGSPWVPLSLALFIMGVASAFSAFEKKNQSIHAAIWNISIGTLCLICIYFLFETFLSLAST